MATFALPINPVARIGISELALTVERGVRTMSKRGPLACYASGMKPATLSKN